MINLISYVWQLPQNLVGLLLRLVYKGEDYVFNDVVIRMADRMKGGISLGKYIIVSKNAREQTMMHEYGHCLQSKKLGWFYLLVVGLPSILHATFCKCKRHSYYDVYPENWADKLGGVKRK